MPHGLYNSPTIHAPWIVQHATLHGSWVVQHFTSHGSWIVQSRVGYLFLSTVGFITSQTIFLENYSCYMFLSKSDYTSQYSKLERFLLPKPLQTQLWLSLPTYATFLFLSKHKPCALTFYPPYFYLLSPRFLPYI